MDIQKDFVLFNKTGVKLNNQTNTWAPLCSNCSENSAEFWLSCGTLSAFACAQCYLDITRGFLIQHETPLVRPIDQYLA